MGLDRFPVNSLTVNLLAGRRTYRVTTLEATVKVNDLTIVTSGDNRFAPLARVCILSQYGTPYSASGGTMITDCHPYWSDDIASIWHIWIVATPGALTLPASSEFSIRQSFEGIPGKRLNVNLDGTAPLTAADALGPFVSIKGIGSNQLEIWGHVPSTQATAAEYKIVFGVAIETSSPIGNTILGDHVTAIP